MNNGLKVMKRTMALLCSAAIVAASVAGCGGGDTAPPVDTGKAKSDIVQGIIELNLPAIEDDYTVNLGYYN